MVLTSKPLSPGVDVTWRRPFTRTSVRSVPKPRRSRRLKPAVPMKRLELPELNVERSDGRSFNASPSDNSPVPVRSSMVTDVKGTADCNVGRAIREPVTRIGCVVPSSKASSDSVATSSSAFAGSFAGALCAKEGIAANKAKLNADPAINKRVFFIKSSPAKFSPFHTAEHSLWKTNVIS